MHNSDPIPQGVENRNIPLWFKCVRYTEFTYFYDFSIECWNCSDSVIYIFFHFIIDYVKKTAELQLLEKNGFDRLIFRMHNSDPIPQGVENRNIPLWFKCVLTAFALHVNCMILFDKVLYLEQKKGTQRYTKIVNVM
jgi:hypothetical protein